MLVVGFEEQIRLYHVCEDNLLLAFEIPVKGVVTLRDGESILVANPLSTVAFAHGGHFFAFLAAQSYSMPQSRQALSVGTAHGTALSQRSRSNSSSRSLPVLEEEAEGEMVLLDGPETAEHEMLVTATAQEPPSTASMAHMWSGSLRLEPRRRQRRMTAPARE